MKYSIYNADGFFVANGECNQECIAENTPAGYNAIEGCFDPLSQRVDINTGYVIAYQPPQPSIEYEWNPATKRWQLNATAAGRSLDHRHAMARIEELEKQQARPVRELHLNPSNLEALDRLMAIEVEISKLRAVSVIRSVAKS